MSSQTETEASNGRDSVLAGAGGGGESVGDSVSGTVAAPGSGVAVARGDTKPPRAGWQMPPKPMERCEDCGGEIVAIARREDDYEGYVWWLCWFCADCNTEYYGAGGENAFEWPYEDEEGATEGDLESLGFTITEDD